jgi:hypothetical protein
MQIRNAWFFVFAAVTASAGDLPYVGKWKLNQTMSDFTGTTITYTHSGGGWQSSAEGHSYQFKMDGKDYPDGMGNTAAWKAVEANTWQTTWKLNGKALYTDTLKLETDGNSLTINAKGTMPNGEAMDTTASYQRASGGPGLAGKWKTTTVKSSSPEVVEFAPSGTDGLLYQVPAMGLSCDGKLDGKDYACTGPTLPPGWTLAMAPKGPRALDMAVKKDGKPFFQITFTVAADGKSMSETGGAVATGEKVKIVYDKQ